MEKENKRLREWQDKYSKSLAGYKEREKFNERDELYNGSKSIDMGNKSASSVWNIVAELIESQTDNTIPIPKVTPCIADDKHKKLAKVIVDMINNELDRLPVEEMNDEDERMTKVNGGTISLIEWDTTEKTHNTVGDISMRLLDARQFIPQLAVYELRHMDYFFVTFDETKERIKKRYNKDVKDEGIDTRTSEVDSTSEETVTQVVCYYMNNKGGLGCFSWVGDTVLIDDDNYEARKDKVCANCGKAQADGEKECICGSDEWVKRDKEYEYLSEDIPLSDGRVIPAYSPARDENGEYIMEDYEEPMYSSDGMPMMQLVLKDGLPVYDETGRALDEPIMQTKQRPRMEPTKIPYYYPRRYPVSIRKNISKNNYVLGISDVDLIRDHQTAINKLLTKDDTILLKAARIIPYIKNHPIHLTDETYQPIEFDAVAVQYASALDLSVNDAQIVAAIQQRYYMAQSTLGITPSYQGKADSTATSGRAKEAQIMQAAGRQRSKKVMKNAAAAEKYEMIFKFMLAYSDEPRSYVSQDKNGQQVQSVFNKYDFLEQDEYGNWYYDDQYLFSVDESGVDASNKQFMLEDLRTDFGLGAYGDAGDPETILSYWKEKDVIGYPNAGRRVEEWTERVREIKQREAVQQLQILVQSMQMGVPPEQLQQMGIDPNMIMQNMPEQEGDAGVPIDEGIPRQDMMAQEVVTL